MHYIIGSSENAKQGANFLFMRPAPPMTMLCLWTDSNYTVAGVLGGTTVKPHTVAIIFSPRLTFIDVSYIVAQ